MPKNLRDAFGVAKKARKVQSKLIISESGVAKSHFYRIINGKDTPSLETKKRISDSFEIDCDQFDLLHIQSKTGEGSRNITTVDKGMRPTMVMTVSVLFVSLAMLTAFRYLMADPVTVETAVSSENDRTLFIKDVTIPDGSEIPINTRFEKTWRVKNIGTVAWKDRYLLRTTPASRLICSSPPMVPIPETLPGQTVDISVTFTTPHLPGSCRTDWKAADKHGNLYFPEMHGLFTIVVVVTD